MRRIKEEVLEFNDIFSFSEILSPSSILSKRKYSYRYRRGLVHPCMNLVSFYKMGDYLLSGKTIIKRYESK